MQFDAINARISSIRDNAEETGRFVEEYKPFIASCTEKVTGRYVSYGTDDELSIAMMAFESQLSGHSTVQKAIFSLFPEMLSNEGLSIITGAKSATETSYPSMYI